MDPFATITELDAESVSTIARNLETRAAAPKQQAMLDDYLAGLPLDGARVLEAGCGTGPVARRIAAAPGVVEVVGLDPSPQLLEQAQTMAMAPETAAKLHYKAGDAREMPFDDARFDIVVFHTSLCHVPGPDGALREAWRVLRRGGHILVFDSDHPSATLATSPLDPVQVCTDASTEGNVLDPWLIRKLPGMMREAGFIDVAVRGHGYLETEDPEYLLTRAKRGADFLVEWGRIGPDLGAALKAEMDRRVDAGTFFGFMHYASVTAARPD